MVKEKGSGDHTAALSFSTALTNTKGLRALSPFCRQGNTEVRVGHCPRKGEGRAQHPQQDLQAALCSQGLSQAVLPRHGDQHLDESWLPSHKKEKRRKHFPFHRQAISATPSSYDFSYRDTVVGYSPAQIQVNCFLRRGQEEQCCQGCLQHPQGPTLGQKHLPQQATERELPATLPVPQHTLPSRVCPAGTSCCGVLYLDASWHRNSLIHDEGMIQQTVHICSPIFSEKKNPLLALQKKMKISGKLCLHRLLCRNN